MLRIYLKFSRLFFACIENVSCLEEVFIVGGFWYEYCCFEELLDKMLILFNILNILGILLMVFEYVFRYMYILFCDVLIFFRDFYL